MVSVSIPVARPPWTGLGRRIESMVRKALYDYEMLTDCDKLVIALSGGKDSLTLLFMLKAILGRGFPDAKLYAVYVGGKYTCGAGVDTGYLQAICQELEVELLIRESQQELETLECYSCSRERRRLIFDAAKSVGAHTVAFGHHRDDHAQTLMMNLLHKGEFAGNLANFVMEDYGVRLLRPLIYVSEQDIRTFSKQEQFARILCRCPVGQNSMRKQVDDLLDQMEELFPNARANLARAGWLYGSDKAARR